MTTAEELRAIHDRAQSHLDNARLLEGARHVAATRFWLALYELEHAAYSLSARSP